MSSSAQSADVIVLDGATASGKSYLLQRLSQESAEFEICPKYTTRPPRPTDNSWEFRFVQEIPKAHNVLSWRTLQFSYAIDTSVIRAILDAGKRAVLICTEASPVMALAESFNLAWVYVYRPMTGDQVDVVFRERGATPDDRAARLEERMRILETYQERLAHLDCVLLNIGTKEELLSQFHAVTFRSE